MPLLGVGVRVPSFAPANMNETETLTTTNDTGTVVGKSDLAQNAGSVQMQTTVRLPATLVDRELNRLLRHQALQSKVPGFRKTSKVVPPAVRTVYSERFLQQILHRHTTIKIDAQTQEEGHSLVPDLRLSDYERTSDEYVVKCVYELWPEIPAPDLNNIRLRLPVATVASAVVDRTVAKIRRQLASWQQVERPATADDKVKIRYPGSEKDLEIDLADTSIPPAINKALIGAQTGDEVQLKFEGTKNNEQPPVDVKMIAVFAAKLPAEDLVFARQVFPEAGSYEAFLTKVAEQLQVQAAKMADEITNNRIIHALDVATQKLALPEQYIGHIVADRMQTMRSRAREANIDPQEIKESELREAVCHDLRRGLIVREFAKQNDMEVSDKQITDHYAMQIQQTNENPAAAKYKKNITPDIKNKLRSDLLVEKIREKIVTMVTIEKVSMGVDELNYIMHTSDPETSKEELSGP